MKRKKSTVRHETLFEKQRKKDEIMEGKYCFDLWTSDDDINDFFAPEEKLVDEHAAGPKNLTETATMTLFHMDPNPAANSKGTAYVVS